MDSEVSPSFRLSLAEKGMPLYVETTTDEYTTTTTPPNIMSTIPFASYLLVLVLLPFASALKFDMVAHHPHESASKERCIRNFVAKDQLVVVTANVDGSRGDGQELSIHVRSHVENYDCY